MSHPTDGDLRAFLDGETSTLEATGVEKHLEACPPCRVRRDDLLRAEAAVRDALDRETPEPDMAAARQAIRRRLERTAAAPGDRGNEPTDERGSGQRTGSGWRGRGALARAAVLVLLIAGGASAALPGSPVRQWLDDLVRPEPATEAPAPPHAPPEVDGARDEDEGELRVAPDGGTIRVDLIGAEPGTRIRVTLVELESAGVVTDAGARFRSGPGRMEVANVRGEVRVEIPRAADDARVTANGRLLFRKEGSTLTLPSADPDTTGTEMLFHVPPERQD